MIAWVYFAAVVAFVTLVGCAFWNDIGSWYTHEPRECIGCQRHFVKPGCPAHDPEARKVAA